MTGRNSRDFWDLAADIIDNDELMDKTDQIGDDLGIIKAVKSLFSWTPSTLNENESFKKSSAKSMKYAEEAIKAGNAREKGRSLKLANMITAFAVDAGDLALGHFVRFLLIEVLQTGYHLKIEELEFCVKSRQLPKKMNPNITLENNLGQQISPNDFTKKQMLQMFSGVTAESESEDVKKQLAVLGAGKDEKKIKFTRDHFTLKNPNPKAPALEDFVEIRYNSVKGRHLIVTKDVPAGKTVFVEKPFVSGLGNVFELEINHCHHCFKKDFVPIPCPNCVFVLYCSEKCLEESKEYHKQYECSVFPDLHALLDLTENNVRSFCAYTTICTFGPQKIFDAFQKQQLPKKQSEAAAKSKSKDESDDCEIPGVDPETGIYDSSSFYTITHMSQVKDCCSTEDALIALALIKILEARTDFFEQLESELKSKKVKTRFQDFIAQSITNISNSYGVESYPEQEYFDEPFGNLITYIFSLQPTHKLSNHSCEGNLSIGGTSNLKGLGTSGVIVRDVKKGEELCRMYATPFVDVKKQARQEELLERFGFVCECVACLNDWPLMKKLEAEKDRPKFCCPLCSHKIPPQPEMMTKENFEMIALNCGNNLICPECKSEYKEEELMTQFKRHSMALTIAEKLIRDRKGQETLNSLKAASSFFQNYLIPPSYYQEKCAELTGQAIVNSFSVVYD